MNSYDQGIEFKEFTTETTMNVKLMPMLAAVMAISAVATPFTVKAQPIHGQPLLAQAQQHQGKRLQLNLTDAQKAQLRQIEIETHNLIQSVFTAEQREKLKTLMQQNRQGNRQARRDVMSQLNLTDAQKAKIKEIKQAQKARMDAVFTPEQKQQLQQMHQQWQQQRQQQGN